MKLFTFLFTLLLVSFSFAQSQPRITYHNLTIAAEQNGQIIFEARTLAEKLGLPHTIYTPESVFIEARGIENGKIVYAIVNNVSDPINSGSVGYWEDIQANYDLAKSRVHYSRQEVHNPTLGYPEIKNTEAITYLMVVESTNDRVMLFDPANGDLIDANFIVDVTNFNTPIEALLSPALTVLTSNQIGDNVVIHDTNGVFNSIFYGGNTAVLDNVRGTAFTPGFSSLLVTVGGGANSDAVAEIDPFGIYLGNFIDSASGGLLSPFDIVFRTNDCLVAGINSDAVHRYDLAGNPLGIFASGISFPEQIAFYPNGNVLVVNFSTPNSGVILFDSVGTQISVFTGVTGNRGVYALGNGNILTTNGSGVHEIDGGTGTLVRTVVAGVSGRFIAADDLTIIPVELTSFVGSTVNGNVVLNWKTATEINNSGFEIQKSSDRVNFSNIAFVPGFGTTTEPRSYSYTDNSVTNGKYYYRLKQVDLNGAFAYSEIIEVNVAAPIDFALTQNYPNPFNPSTIISYSIPQNSFVTLKVYDILGNEIAVLVNDTKSAGKYDVQFDASGLSNGVYFYTIKADNFTSTKKMILMK
ncbi:MAG: T9SS type A sorting domain-containing protein [Ignavibacteriaceae bacterium]